MKIPETSIPEDIIQKYINEIRKFAELAKFDEIYSSELDDEEDFQIKWIANCKRDDNGEIIIYHQNFISEGNGIGREPHDHWGIITDIDGSWYQDYLTDWPPEELFERLKKDFYIE